MSNRHAALGDDLEAEAVDPVKIPVVFQLVDKL
jgi:hypothetical protein